jgi:hypothetical protein
MLWPTVCWPVCLGIKHPSRGLQPDFNYCQKVEGLLIWGALSDERTGLSFMIAAGPHQRSHSWVRVLWDSQPYLRLPLDWTVVGYSLYSLRLDHSTENTSIAQQWIYVNHTLNASCDTGSIVAVTELSHSNGSYPIFAYIFVSARMCLPSCCLEMGLHVTVWKQKTYP